MSEKGIMKKLNRIFLLCTMRNLLAKEQQKMCESNISEEEKNKREDIFNDLYYKLREKDYNSFLGNLSFQTRKKLHKLVWLIFICKNRLCGFSCEVIKNKREKNNRPLIFALTHVGKFDIEVSAVPIKDHFYLLSGDYEHLQGTIDGMFLLLNGVFYFNEKVKWDRSNVVERMIEHLKSGRNLMYFPEGTWNLSPNLPVLPCYWGIVDVAQKSNAIIVPIAVEQYDKRFKINIGKNFDMLLFGSNSLEKQKAIDSLRDVLATLKWEIWQTEQIVKRENLLTKEWDQYINARLAEWPFFSIEYIDGMIYKPKGFCTHKNVFAHLNTIVPTVHNSFLFNKRLKG